MKVKCWETGCEYHSLCDDTCLKEEIEIDDGCMDLMYHTYISEEYQNPFYKHMRSIKDLHTCKKLCKGKKIEKFGLVFYTTDDDRYGDAEIGLTEEITGYYCGTLGELTEKRCDEIREKMKTVPPVRGAPDGVDFEDW